jgi:hypothetical protein
MKPTLELGFTIPAGPIPIKTAIRGAVDIHEFSFTPVGSVKKVQDYMEPSWGLTVWFDFLKKENTHLELDLTADAGLRLYNEDNSTEYDASKIGDLRFIGNPSLLFRNDFGNRVILGVKTNVGIGFDLLQISGERTTKFSLAPAIGGGVQFNLLPNRFAMHGGLGLTAMSFSQVNKNAAEIDWAPANQVSFGVNVHFTESTALDLAVAVSDLFVKDHVGTNFTVLFSIKK